MSRAVTFGIVGGCGAIGRTVASVPWKSSYGEILIRGRDSAEGKALAAASDTRVRKTKNSRRDVSVSPPVSDENERRPIIRVSVGGRRSRAFRLSASSGFGLRVDGSLRI